MKDPGGRAAGGYSVRRAILVGGLGLGVTLLPLFLTGALAVEITEELRFGTVGLGMVIAIHRLASAPTAIFAGRLADWLGAGRSLRLSSAMAATACLGVSLGARSWGVLAICLAISGGAMTIADPAANRLLVHVVPRDRLGSAFGFKQSAPPSTTMLAGLSVPLVAAMAGWRTAFVVSALAAVLVILAIGRLPRRAPRATRTAPRAKLGAMSTILLLATALGLGTASSATIPAFYVVGATEAGVPTALAGALLAAASVLTIVTRMAAGLLSDRLVGGHLKVCAMGQLVGGCGLLLLATNRPAAMMPGVVLALAGTWGFHGVYWYAMVRAYPDTPGAITGALAPGPLLGGVASPLTFGAIAAGPGYRSAWLFATCLAVLATIATLAAARRLDV